MHFILDCLTDVLATSGEDFESGDEIFEAVGEVMMEANAKKTESQIQSLCERLLDLLKPSGSSNGGASANGSQKILDAPVHLGSLGVTEDDKEDPSSIWLAKVEDNLVRTQDKIALFWYLPTYYNKERAFSI